MAFSFHAKTSKYNILDNQFYKRKLCNFIYFINIDFVRTFFHFHNKKTKKMYQIDSVNKKTIYYKNLHIVLCI